MQYPECQRTDCRFVRGYSISTAMHSPIQYDRDGRPVGGGMNTTTTEMQCLTCGRMWAEKRTDLEMAQGVPPKWQAL